MDAVTTAALAVVAALSSREAWAYWQQRAKDAEANAAKVKQNDEAAQFNARITRNRQPAKAAPPPAKAEQPRGDDGRFKPAKGAKWDDIFDEVLADQTK